jgi:hypothetical protein
MQEESGSEPLDLAHPRGDARSIGDLLADLRAQSGALIRQEAKLATAEMTHKGAAAARQVALIALGALLGVVSAAALAAALVLGLAAFVSPWLSALLVGAATGVAAYAVVAKGIAGLRAVDLVPTRTIESLQANRDALEEELR